MKSSLRGLGPRFGMLSSPFMVALGGILLSGCDGGHCDGGRCESLYVRPNSGDEVIVWDEDSFANIQIEGATFSVPLSGEAIVRFEDDSCVPGEESPCLVEVKFVSLYLDKFEFTADGRQVNHDGMAIESVPGRRSNTVEGVWWFDETHACSWGPGSSRDAEANVVRSWTLELSRAEQVASLSTTFEVELPLDNRCGSAFSRISIFATSRGLWRRER